MTRARRISILLGLLPLLGACAAPKPLPELPRQLPDSTPAGFEDSLEARIEESMPVVRYSVTSPQFPDFVYEKSVNGEKTIDRDRIEGWIRELESLDGNPVLCRTANGSVFGECVFPLPDPPKSDLLDPGP